MFPDSLKYFAEQSDTSTSRGAIQYYWAMGKYHYWLSQYDSAYIDLAKAKTSALRIGYPLVLAELSMDLSSCLSITDYVGTALEELLAAQRIIAVFGNHSQKARAGIALAEIHRKMGQYEKSEAALHKAYPFIGNQDELMASYYNRLAAIKTETGKNDSAFYYSRIALDYARRMNDNYLVAVSENEIGYLYRQQNLPDSARYHLELADSLYRADGNIRYALQSTSQLAILKSQEGDNMAATRMLRSGFEVAVEKKWYSVQRDYAQHLHSAYLGIGKEDSAMYYYAQSLAASNNEIIQSNVVFGNMTEVLFNQRNYEQEIRYKELELTEERLRKEEALREKRLLILIVVMTSLIILLTISLILFGIRRRRKIQQEKKEKEIQNNELQLLLLKNEALVKEISHRVKNNLSILSGLLDIQRSRSTNEDLKKELNDTILRIASISSVHNKLYDTKNSGLVDLATTTKELAVNIALSMGYDPGTAIHFRLDTLEMELGRSVNYSLIFNEIVTNSFKYGKVSANCPMEISLLRDGNTIALKVSDYGSGIAPGFDEKQSKSMGLYLVRVLSRPLNADVSWNKMKDIFTVQLTFPLHEK